MRRVRREEKREETDQATSTPYSNKLNQISIKIQAGSNHGPVSFFAFENPQFIISTELNQLSIKYNSIKTQSLFNHVSRKGVRERNEKVSTSPLSPIPFSVLIAREELSYLFQSNCFPKTMSFPV
ncbi:hypothetical protein [Virgibacillus sp. L01]|uniref:hypothetical protein n=1 Tax=Virgibacillus sp. L01 TaxID=3457429 RepID=UPI003FCF61AD